MPLWLEIEILLMFTYAAGLGSGWLLWTRTARSKSEKGKR